MMETNHTLHAAARGFAPYFVQSSLNSLIPAKVLGHQCFTSRHLQQHRKKAGGTAVHALPAMTVMQITCLIWTRNM